MGRKLVIGELALILSLSSCCPQKPPAPVQPQKPVLIIEDCLMDADVHRIRYDVSYRQEFWDQFLEEHPIPYCERIVDDPHAKKARAYLQELANTHNEMLVPPPSNSMASVPAPIFTRGRVAKLPIFIHSGFYAFNPVTNEGTVETLDDVISIVKHHEGFHVREGVEGTVLKGYVINWETFKGRVRPNALIDALDETRAYNNQINQLITLDNVSLGALRAIKFGADPHFKTLYGIQFDDKHPNYARIAKWQVNEFPAVKISHEGETVAVQYMNLPGQ